MNKLQFITLLKMRGITELKGLSIAEAVRLTGGNPSKTEIRNIDINIIQKIRNDKLKKIEEGKDAESK